MRKQLQDSLEWKFSDMIFEEGAHTYTLEGELLPSVSSLVHAHETFVDFEAIGKAVAFRDKKTHKQVKAEWKAINKEACDTGHATHNYAEFYSPGQVALTPLEEAAKSYLDELPEYYEVITKELRMYSRKYKYAGTTDLLLLDKRDGTLVIADYKTNKDLFKSYQMLQAPFDTMEQNNYNKYQLQLSYYQILLEEAGYTISDRIIIWLQRDGTYKTFHTFDFTKELRQCMKAK